MEVTTHHRVLPVTESSMVSAARLAAQALGEVAHFGEEDVYRLGLVATELATNLVKHATSGGELLARVVSAGPIGVVELVAIDGGPGMMDVGASMVDGHSTAGSPGTGFGAVRRLSDEFDVYSQPERGTVVFVRIHGGRKAVTSTAAMQVAGVSVAVAGEELCGDAWMVRHEVDAATAVVADGLGHGIYASEAAEAAIAAFAQQRFAATADALQAMHDGTKHTRGAAAAVAEVRPGTQTVKFAGIGNISGVICHGGATRQAVSHNGILGQGARHFKEYSYPWTPEAVLVMHSDGLSTHWSLDAYRGLRQRHPAVIAAVLYRDFTRHRDDVTVVVGKETG